MQSTFLRSATHATDSTLRGCDRKQRGHHQAARGISGEPLQNQEQQQRVRRMQQEAGVVMAHWIELKKSGNRARARARSADANSPARSK